MRCGGRPKVEVRRTKRVPVYLTDAEMETLKRMAGSVPLGIYLRDLGLGARRAA
jgi:hypothetical protein